MYDIIMPVGDYQEITSKSINSALNQTLIYQKFIFIIDTKNDLEANKIKNIINHIERSVIIRTQRIGQGKARQCGLNASTSEFLAFLDYDDIWHPQKMELQIEKMKKENSVISFTSYRAISVEKKQTIFNVHCKRKISLFNFFICCPIGVSTVVVKRKLFLNQTEISIAKKRWDYITWFKLWRDLNPKHSICSDYLTLIVKRRSSISSNYWTSPAGYLSMQKAFKNIGFNNSFSYVVALFYSILQIPVKIKRILFKYFLKNSSKVKDFNIGYFLQ